MTSWNSRDYQKGIQLRNQLLKKSAGKELIQQAPFEEKNDYHLVVKRDRQVVGTLLLHPVNQEIVQIKQVAIDKSCQGLGLGRQLIDYAEKVAANLNFSVVFLTGRKQAWTFYEKLNYDSFPDSYQEGLVELRVFKKGIKINQTAEEMKTNGRQ